MKVDESLIKHIAQLARIDLTPSEIKKFTPQLKEVLKAFDKLKNVKTTNVIPAFHPIELKNQLREDFPVKCLSQEQALSLSKHKKDGYFKGPRVL